MAEVLAHYAPQFAASDVLARLQLTAGNYFVVSCHREENIDDATNFAGLLAVLDGLVKKYDVPVIFSAHPRTRKKLEAAHITLEPRIQLMKPIGFADYINLQQHAKAVLSDSGTISEESSILNFPALNIRQAHERPEAMEEASVMLTGLMPERVFQALAILESQPRGDKRLLNLVADYAMPNVSDKVVRIILSYTDVVNRTVWRKS
jgi:UDP-N-acetylglucosamine 2-epimerase (non-hydrolysing)